MSNIDLAASLLKPSWLSDSSPKLRNGSKVAVMGGGPAGSFFAYFLLSMAQRVSLNLQLDIYEPRDFSRPGSVGCNMDAGIISESLVQHMAAEGIKIPPAVVRQGIDSYVLHMDVGSVRIAMPIQEKRIASVYRGSGPEGSNASSFDAFCLSMAIQKGARLVSKRIEAVSRVEDGIVVQTRKDLPAQYDLLAVATGVNTNALRLFKTLEPGFQPPGTIRSMVREYHLGTESVEKYLGSTLHVFLLDIPGLDFAAIIPKYDMATVCFLGTDVTEGTFTIFLESPEVRQCMPPDWQPDQFVCHCIPRMQKSGAIRPYADRLVFIGDSGVSRLYKDGIGAAFRTAKAAANTAIFFGIGLNDFQDHYQTLCQSITDDNRKGKLIFAISRQVQHRRFGRNLLLQSVRIEQVNAFENRISSILWDTFTGSSPYYDIFMRPFHPAFLAGLLGLMGVFTKNSIKAWIGKLRSKLPQFGPLAKEQ